MDANAYVDFATLAVKAGQTPDPATGALNTPIYETTTFAYPDMATYEQKSQAALRWTPGYYFYSRSANPTTAALEQKVAALEGAEATAVTACGMGAVNAALMSLLDAGDHCVASDDLFVVSTRSLQQLYPAKGIQVDRVDITDHRQIEAAIRPNTKVLYLEALSNPHLKLADLDALAQLAHSRGLKLVVDNTFLSPCLLRPLDHGADLVIHSGTKYLAGHGDALCGLVSGKKELVDRVRDYSDMLGSHISPFDAWLVLRGIRTLHLRLERQCQNALALARWLEAQPQVAYVLYPGLEDHPQHALAQKLLPQGFGGMLAFHLTGGMEAMGRFVDALRSIPIATSLGDVGTLLDPLHRDDGLIRLSVGCEGLRDLTADLERGFAAL